jgi:(p)ppGpp synthase/HD superfamily hydrolase
LFVGRYRCSGKPFVAHVVGASSVLAAVDGRRYLVLAALLHAAYTHGDFGTRRGSMEEPARLRVRTAVGPDAEELVFAYAQTPWNSATLAAASANFEHFDARQRNVLVLRLANEADEHADRAVPYCCRDGLDRYSEPTVATMADLADRLERPALATLHRELVAEERDVTVPRYRSLRGSRHSSRHRRRTARGRGSSYGARSDASGAWLVARSRRSSSSTERSRKIHRYGTTARG